MDAADPLRAARPEEAGEKPKGAESQDDGYETSNSGEARRGEVAPEPPPPPQPAEPPPPLPAHLPAPLHDAHYEPLMRHYPSPAPQPYRQFEQEQDYQHFPFPKYSEPYDMSQHQGYKRDEEMYNGVKRECEDPYSFVEEEAMSLMLNAQHHQHPQLHHDPHQMMHHQMMINQPKKRGRKKKIKDENGMEIKTEPGMEGPPRPVKERKKHDRFNGMSEEEVARRTLPDHLAENLDIIIIGINPGLFAAYKGHHYAGPGNHFWKCLYLSGLTREQMSADEDYKLLNFGIGFTNMVPRATKGSADLTRREIKEGSAALLEKLQTFRPKVAVFNGKLIYEVFSGKKDFCFGKQPDTIAGTNTYMWVMPSSSARCAQLPRAADKVPFYAALKKFRDYLNGLLPHLDETELVFPDNTARRPHEEMEIRRLTMEPEPGDTIILEDGTEVPLKKKRGRPKKVKLENGEVVPPTPRAPRAPRPPPALDAVGDQPPKKKRGRPKKIRPEEQQFLLQQQQAQQQQQQQTQQQQQQVQQQQQQQQVGGGLLQNQLGGLGLPHEQQYMSGFGLDNPLYMQPQPEHDNTHSHYYQPNNANAPLEQGMDMSGMSLSRPYGSPGAASGGPAAGYSPRPVYHSPRSQGYSPQPPRHTPQPQNQFPPSPGVYSGGGGRALPPLPARSPLYASPPAPPYPQGSPAPQSHRPQFARSPQYSRSPAPPRPYSRSPAPAGAAPGAAGSFGASSPAPLHSYTPSPQHTPYSQHESPVPNNNQPHYLHTETGSTGAGSAGSGSGSYGGELGEGLPPLSPVGGAVEAPPSPAPALDFSPPRDPPPPSPPPPSDMHVGSNSNSSLSDYNKNSQPGSDMSPAGVNVGSVPTSFPPAMYDSDARLPYHLHSPHMDKEHYHYQQDQGSSGVGDSPRLDQMHQHPSMYPTNFNRATPEGGETGFRPPDTPHTPHHHPGSPVEYGSNVKPKSQDVASKSLSGLESLVDQIPSIAEGPVGGAPAPAPADQPAAPVAALPEYAPALYGPYSAYGGAAYPNNGYGSAFVGYGGGWGGGLMRAAPGYLPEWQYGYAPPVPPSYPYNPTYYNGYTPPQQTHYLSAPPLLELHKNGEGAGVPGVPSVPFGSFC